MIEPTKKLLAAPASFVAEGPRPLTRDIIEQEPYPVEALGDLRLAALAIGEHTRAPTAICAQAILGALSLALQGHADVVLPTGSASPLSLFLLTIAASGERKSAVDRLALKPVYEHEDWLREAHIIEQARFVTEHAIWSGQQSEAVDEPEPPLTPLLVCPEPTFEGYCRLTATGLPALGLYSAEGGAFIGGFGMSADHRLKTAAALSSLWDGDPIKRVRAGEGVTILAGRRLSLHLMVQPEVADQLIGDSLLVSQGLLSRILATSPPSTAGTRVFAYPSEAAKVALVRYHRALTLLLEAPLPIADGTRNELKPRRLSMSQDATRIWIGLHDFIEERLIEGGEFAPVSGFANKAAEHAARVAGILTLWSDLDAEEISAATMANASVLIQHYVTEALRLRDMALVSQHLKLTVKVLEWIQNRWTEPAIYPAAIYNDCTIKAVRNRKVALSVIATLEEHGWLMRIPDQPLIKGVRRKEAWLIHGRTM